MNPLLQRLGFGPNDRVAIVHADDIGAYQASLPAIADLFEAGLVSSCATMVPCPWFPAVVAFARANPSADIGVHTTITSEYELYRWGPVGPRDPASGLLDADGYFHRSVAGVMAAAPEAVAAELRVQVERALAAGIDVTHVDSHMGAVFIPAFLPGYLAAAEVARVPAFLLRADAQQLRERGLPEPLIAQLLDMLREAEASGLPVVDHLAMMPLERHADRVAEAKAVFDALPPGLSYVILHPAQDTPELRAAAPSDWQARAADYEAFCSRELRDYVRSRGVQVIGWRTIRDALRAS